jgi:hypothetical protein
MTIQAAIEFMAQNGTQINRFWINCFVKPSNNIPTIQTANLLEKERRNVSEAVFPRSASHHRSLWQNRHG